MPEYRRRTSRQVRRRRDPSGETVEEKISLSERFGLWGHVLPPLTRTNISKSSALAEDLGAKWSDVARERR